MITDNTFKDLTRAIPGSGGVDSSERLFLLSADMDQWHKFIRRKKSVFITESEAAAVTGRLCEKVGLWDGA